MTNLIIILSLFISLNKPIPKCEGIVVAQTYSSFSDSAYVYIEIDQELKYSERRTLKIGYLRDFMPDMLSVVKFDCNKIKTNIVK